MPKSSPRVMTHLGRSLGFYPLHRTTVGEWPSWAPSEQRSSRTPGRSRQRCGQRQLAIVWHQRGVQTAPNLGTEWSATPDQITGPTTPLTSAAISVCRWLAPLNSVPFPSNCCMLMIRKHIFQWTHMREAFFAVFREPCLANSGG